MLNTSNRSKQNGRMMAYLWEDLDARKFDDDGSVTYAENKFGDHFISEDLSFDEALINTQKYIRQSLGRQKHKFDQGRIVIHKVWDISKYAKKIDKFYPHAKVDDVIRHSIENHIQADVHAIDARTAIEQIEHHVSTHLEVKPIRQITLREGSQDKMLAASRNTDKCLMVAGCGIGKTFVELGIMEENVPSNKQVNILITSGIELANQISQEFSDNTVMGLQSGGWHPVIVHSGRSTLPLVEATTDEERIAQLINQSNGKPVWLIVVYDSVRTAGRGIAISGRTVNVKVMDEVHRTVSNGDTKFTWAVRLRCKKQYGLSASYRNIRLENSPGSSNYEYDEIDSLMFDPPASVYSMNDESIYGPIPDGCSYSYRKAVEMGVVVDTAVHILHLDEHILDEMESDGDVLLRDGTGEDIELKTDGQKALAAGMIAARTWLSTSIKKGIVNKTLVFFNRISDCERGTDPDHPLSLLPKDDTDLFAVVYHSQMNNNQRHRARTSYSDHDGPALLASVRAIREGVSINSADTAIFLRGYGTSDDGEGISVEMQQHHGRVVRTAKGKKICNIAIPIPPIGRADGIRRNILQMIRNLLEELGVLAELIDVIESDGRITTGSLTANNIHIHANTVIGINEIEDAVNYTVMEYIKQYNEPLYNKLSEKDLDTYIDEFNF